MAEKCFLDLRSFDSQDPLLLAVSIWSVVTWQCSCAGGLSYFCTQCLVPSPASEAAQKKKQQHQSQHHRQYHAVQLLTTAAMMVLKSFAVSCRLKIRGLSGIGGIKRNGTNAFALIKISYLMIKVRLESLLKKWIIFIFHTSKTPKFYCLY